MTCLTNNYAIVGESKDAILFDLLSDSLRIPVIETSINKIKTVGNLVAGNKNGLLCPFTISDQELSLLRHELPENISIARIDDRLNALGNLILCNDYVAVVHPGITKETEEMIADTLKVDVFRLTIGDSPLVGSFAALNNQGLLVQNRVSDSQTEELTNLLNVQVCRGTVNKGSDMIGAGIVVNDWNGFCGLKSTPIEIKIMQKIFNISELPENIERKEGVETV